MAAIVWMICSTMGAIIVAGKRSSDAPKGLIRALQNGK
jgi:hypothetical protein